MKCAPDLFADQGLSLWEEIVRQRKKREMIPAFKHSLLEWARRWWTRRYSVPAAVAGAIVVDGDGEACTHSIEYAVQTCADSADARDDHQCDQGGQQAIFNRGHAAIVFEKAFDVFPHDVRPFWLLV
jgi:hypothetical protein